MSLTEDFHDDPTLRSAFQALDQKHPAILDELSRAEVALGGNFVPKTAGFPASGNDGALS